MHTAEAGFSMVELSRPPNLADTRRHHTRLLGDHLGSGLLGFTPTLATTQSEGSPNAGQST